MKKISLYSVLIICLFSSCSDWLQIKPKGIIIPEKTEDYQLLLSQTASNGVSVGWIRSYGNDLYVSDDMLLNDGTYLNKISESARKAYTWSDNIYLEIEEDPDWNHLYNQIYVANIIIREVMSSIGSENLKKQLYAEALAQRSFAYWILVNLYSKQYNPASAANDLGVPLLSNPVLEGSLRRASVQEVYDFILKDLTISKSGPLPSTSNTNHRVSLASVYALLARVYLHMGDYSNALEYASLSITKYNFLYDYNTMPKSTFYTSMIDFPRQHLNAEQILNRQAVNQYSLIYPSKELLDSYDKANDLRYTGMYEKEWFSPFDKLIYMTEYMTGRVYGLSVPEMILIQAECYARKGNVAEAMERVNVIRQKRVKTIAYVPLTATTGEEALNIVKKERRIELAFKGLRWFDLKRYNEYDNANISISRTVNGKTYTLTPKSNKWALPIGQKYILKNPEIEQNPR